MAGLSPEKIAELQETLISIQDNFDQRLGELNREIRNLRKRGARIAVLGEETTEEGTKTALAVLESVGAPVA
jgi:hypothetical protein